MTKQVHPASHERFAQSLLDELSRRDPDGAGLGTESELEQAVRLVVDQVLAPAAIWQEHLGAFYDTEGVRRLLGSAGSPVSRQAVHKRKGLLALTTGSGQVVYPAAQFRGRTLAPRLDKVLAALPPDLVSGWTVASWLVSPESDLDGERPLDVLFEGPEAARARVVESAVRWADQLAA